MPRYPKIGLPEKADITWLTIPKPGMIRIYQFIINTNDVGLYLYLNLIMV
jgi:hypothetical protein